MCRMTFIRADLFSSWLSRGHFGYQSGSVISDKATGVPFKVPFSFAFDKDINAFTWSTNALAIFANRLTCAGRIVY